MITLEWNFDDDVYEVLDGTRQVASNLTSEQVADWFAARIASGEFDAEMSVPSTRADGSNPFVYTAAGVADFSRESEENTCRSCDAYVHRYLPRCPVCGHDRPV